MNDRFKFRAYNKELRKMYEVDTICPYEDNHTKGGEVFLKGIQYNSFYFPEEVEVMQSTGLKDKNGKLIYEGDVVKYGLHNCLVEWYKGGFWANGFINGAKWEMHQYHNTLEVIGNIYENKDLLNA